MNEQLADVGAYFSIIGLVITVVLTIIVVKFDKNRRKREEEFYMIQTKSSIHDILSHFVEIDRISQTNDFEEEENEEQLDEEKQAEILLHLNRYYKQNYKKMEMLLENVQETLVRWGGLDKDKRQKYAEIIEEFKWLVNDYFSTKKSEDIQIRM